MKKIKPYRIIVFLVGLFVGFIPCLILTGFNYRYSYFVGNLDKYQRLNINFQEEVKDNFMTVDEIYIKGHHIADISFDGEESNYAVNNIVFYHHINDSIELMEINYTLSTDLYHDSCFFYLSTDTAK